MIRSVITQRLLSSRPNSSILSSPSSSWFLHKNHNQINNVNNDDVIKRPLLTWSSASYRVSSGGYMRGAVFWEAIKLLTIEEFHQPRPKPGEILIKTKSCGVCNSDLHVIKGEIPFASPCVVGHEITGEVVEHGPLTDNKIFRRFLVGSRVVGAFIMPCGNCFFCSKGHDDLCEDFFAYNRAKGTLYDGETRLFLNNSGN